MKCPGCRFVCSDSRDICPKCLLDLRPHKTAMGIPVRNPHLRYGELMAQLGGPARSGRKKKPGLWKKLFSRRPKKQEPANAEQSNPAREKQHSASSTRPSIATRGNVADEASALQPTAAAAAASAPPAPPAAPSEPPPEAQTAEAPAPPVTAPPVPAPEVLDLTESDEGIGGILDDIIGDSALEYRAIAPLADRHGQTPHDDEDEDEEEEEDDDITVLTIDDDEEPGEAEFELELELEEVLSDEDSREPVEEPDQEADESDEDADAAEDEAGGGAPPLPSVDSSALIARLSAGVSQPEPPSTTPSPPPSQAEAPIPSAGAAEIEELAPLQLAISLAQASVHDVQELAKRHASAVPAPPASLDQEFDDAMTSLATDGSAAFECGLEFFQKRLDDAQAAILFDMAYEALDDPEAEERYLEQAPSTQEMRVTSTVLQEALNTVERVMSKPLIGLRTAHLWKKREAAAAPAPAFIVIRPSLHQRWAAFLLDAAYTAAAAVLGTSAYLYGWEPQLREILIDPPHWSAIEIITFAGLALTFLVISAAVYPAACFLVYRNTPGGEWKRIQAVRASGRHMKFGTALLRSVSVPLSMLCFGYIPLVFGGRSLSETISGTDMTVIVEPAGE